MSEGLKQVLEGIDTDKGNLVAMLYRIQKVEGQITPEAVNEISRLLDVSENSIYSVASFYPQFNFPRI